MIIDTFLSDGIKIVNKNKSTNLEINDIVLKIYTSFDVYNFIIKTNIKDIKYEHVNLCHIFAYYHILEINTRLRIQIGLYRGILCNFINFGCHNNLSLDEERIKPNIIDMNSITELNHYLET